MACWEATNQEHSKNRTESLVPSLDRTNRLRVNGSPCVFELVALSDFACSSRWVEIRKVHCQYSCTDQSPRAVCLGESVRSNCYKTNSRYQDISTSTCLEKFHQKVCSWKDQETVTVPYPQLLKGFFGSIDFSICSMIASYWGWSIPRESLQISCCVKGPR